MLHKCANPNCLNPFRRLSQGKLFLVETESPSRYGTGRTNGDKVPHHIEYFWLCDRCSAEVTLSFEKGRGMVTVPLAPAATNQPLATMAADDLDGDGGCASEQPLSKPA